MAATEFKVLRDDILAEVQVAAKLLIRVRKRLLDWIASQSEEGSLGLRLGLGLKDEPDLLGSLRDRVVAAGGPALHLQAVIRANGQLVRLVEQIEAGVVGGTSGDEGREKVKRPCDDMAEALAAAETWARSWKPAREATRTGRGRSPDYSLLDKHELLSRVLLARVLDVSPDNAGRRMKMEEFDEIVMLHGRMHVRSTAVRSALGLPHEPNSS